MVGDMTRKALLLCAMFATGLLPAADPVGMEGEPGAAARFFLSEVRRFQVTGLPDGEAWETLSPCLSAPLRALMEAAKREQLEFMKKFPDEKPPWIEGDFFSSLFEGPHRFQVLGTEVKGDRANVRVEQERTEGGDTVKWTDTLLLVKTPEGWRVDDMRYGGSWDFANTGTLRDALAPEEP
jgi:hypothetical protein